VRRGYKVAETRGAPRTRRRGVTPARPRYQGAQPQYYQQMAAAGQSLQMYHQAYAGQQVYLPQGYAQQAWQYAQYAPAPAAEGGTRRGTRPICSAGATFASTRASTRSRRSCCEARAAMTRPRRL